MTDYEYDNLPYDMNVEPVPAQLQDAALALAGKLAGSGDVRAMEVKIAHVYGRKGYMETDTFGGRRSASYSSGNDDVVLQVTVRVPYPSKWNDKALYALVILENELRAHLAEEERQRLEAEITQAEAAAAKATAAAQAAQDRLNALRAGKP